MAIVKWTAYACFGMAGLSVLLAMGYEAPAFLVGGISVLVIGVGFIAADRVIVLLSDIRNALVPPAAVNAAPAIMVQAGAGPTPTRSAAEIAADIQALKARA